MTFTVTPLDEPTDMLCFNVPIIDDVVTEPDEEFSVSLIRALPAGEFIEDTTCVTIIDNDSK